MRHSKQRISSNECSGQTQDAARESDAAHSSAQRFQAEHADDALGERTAVRRHGEDRSAAPLFHQREGARIFDGVAAESDGHVIAAVLAFGANSFIEPPDRGMVEEQRLHANLENVYKRIEAPDVRQFVRDHQLQLFFGEAAECSYGQEHDGAKPPDHGRRLQPRAFAIRDRTIEAELALQGVANLEHARDSQPTTVCGVRAPAVKIRRRNEG